MGPKVTPLEKVFGTSDAVILCGSGVSAVPPSPLPIWASLNEAALAGLRRLALKSVLTDPDNRRTIRSLSADDVPWPEAHSLATPDPISTDAIRLGHDD